MLCDPSETSSGRKVTQGQKRRKKKREQIMTSILATKFCLQYSKQRIQLAQTNLVQFVYDQDCSPKVDGVEELVKGAIKHLLVLKQKD